MWLNENGAFNTNSFPDPTVVMGSDFVIDILTLAQVDREVLELLITELQEEFVSNDFVYEEQVEERFRGRWLPAGHLEGHVESVAELQMLLTRIPSRWRLDALMAIDELLMEAE